jgi:hypothetical protein
MTLVNQDLDTSWIKEIDDKEKLYDIFYPQEMTAVKGFAVVVSKDGNIIKLNQRRLPVSSGWVEKDSIVQFMHSTRKLIGRNFRLASMAAFHICCTADDVISDHLGQPKFISIDSLTDVAFPSTVDTFHDVASLLIIFREKKPNSTTKKVYISNSKKTRRRR